MSLDWQDPLRLSDQLTDEELVMRDSTRSYVVPCLSVHSLMDRREFLCDQSWGVQGGVQLCTDRALLECHTVLVRACHLCVREQPIVLTLNASCMAVSPCVNVTFDVV